MSVPLCQQILIFLKNQETSEPQLTSTDSTGNNLKEIKIDIYLDGDRKSGIYLGQAKYGIESKEAEIIYGSDYLNTGFELKWDRGEYKFEPGSIHFIYLYTDIPGENNNYIRKEIRIDGAQQTAGNIQLYLESPTESIVEKQISITGWTIDTNSTDGTNIDRVEIYLDGPLGFGKLLGNAKYGLERGDVAEKFDNINYTNSGFKTILDISNLELGSKHSLYIYSFTKTGQYQLIKKDVTIKGTKNSNEINIFINTNLGHDFINQIIEISGWVVNIDYQIKRIVFVSDKNGNEDLYSMNLDGSDLKQLTDSPGSELYPAVSKDGKKIAYSSDINGIWQIMVMNWDGTDKKQLTFGAERSGDPAWSFDNKFIYFEKFIEENWEIYKMDSNGNNLKRITINPVYDDWHPYGHPSEYKILYEAGISGDYDIFIMNDDGSDNKLLLDVPFKKRVPSISKDGKHIVFQGIAKGDKKSNIFIMDPDGKNFRKLTSDSIDYGHAVISPDSQHIVFEGTTKGLKRLFMMKLDGSEKIQITSDTDYSVFMPEFIYILKDNIN